jgi:hypothetical protein
MQQNSGGFRRHSKRSITERYCVVFKTLREPPTIDLRTQLGANFSLDRGG